MALKTVPKITKKQIAENGVQKLADRPNLTGQYGTSGLSATQLKLWFDKLATFLAERINEISGAISSDEAANYIRVCLDECGVGDLGDLVTAFTDGGFAAKILQVYSSATANDLGSLQNVLNKIAESISNNTEDIRKAQRTIDEHKESESAEAKEAATAAASSATAAANSANTASSMASSAASSANAAEKAAEKAEEHSKSALNILFGNHGQPTFYLKDGHLFVRIIKGSVNPYRIENGRLIMTIVKEVV